MESLYPFLYSDTSDLSAVLDQVNARLGAAEPTVSIRLEDILAAAFEGRVDAVVVAENETLWGKFRPGEPLEAHESADGLDEDLVNLAAVQTLRTGGRAFSVPRAHMPRQAAAVALFRY